MVYIPSHLNGLCDLHMLTLHAATMSIAFAFYGQFHAHFMFCINSISFCFFPIRYCMIVSISLSHCKGLDQKEQFAQLPVACLQPPPDPDSLLPQHE